MTDLCEIYDMARETGYYWLRRYQQGGLEALQDRGRAPERHPNQTPERIEEAVLQLRRAFHHFGLEYNQERPHEALGMQTPSAMYTRSLRSYPARVREPEYGSAMRVLLLRP